MREGGSFTEKLSTSYAGIDVKVTMGGVDVTSSCYKNRTINIENVTGDIVITAKGTQTPDTTIPETTVPETTVSETTAPDTTAAASGGCGSSVALAVIPALAVCALTVKRKKK